MFLYHNRRPPCLYVLVCSLQELDFFSLLWQISPIKHEAMGSLAFSSPSSFLNTKLHFMRSKTNHKRNRQLFNNGWIIDATIFYGWKVVYSGTKPKFGLRSAHENFVWLGFAYTSIDISPPITHPVNCGKKDTRRKWCLLFWKQSDS